MCQHNPFFPLMTILDYIALNFILKGMFSQSNVRDPKTYDLTSFEFGDRDSDVKCEFYKWNDSMKQDKSAVFEEFNSPLTELLEKNPYSRECSSLTDEQWVKMGLKRVLGSHSSGRGFLQGSSFKCDEDLLTGHYFDALKSERRYLHLKSLNESLINSNDAWDNCDDPISSECPELKEYLIHLGDGHHHKAPIHEEKVGGKVYSTQHFYAKNIRNHMMWHLAVADYGDTRKKEHDMHMLKRQDIETLRAGAPKGVKSLWIWDKACMSFQQWHEWKRRGIYFLTLEKDLNEFTVISKADIDGEDDVNSCVVKDERVASGTKNLVLRRVTYRCPESGNVYRFITNLPMKIRPGVIAFLYKCRWDIEKSYNTFKHKFGETRAWAVSPTAKAAQANFLCLTHNLSLILNRKVDEEVSKPENSPNYPSKKIKKKRISRLKSQCLKLKKSVPKLLLKVFRLIEIPKSFVRWLQEMMYSRRSWTESLAILEYTCARHKC